MVSSGGMYTVKLDPDDLNFDNLRYMYGNSAYAQNKVRCCTSPDVSPNRGMGVYLCMLSHAKYLSHCTTLMWFAVQVFYILMHSLPSNVDHQTGVKQVCPKHRA